MRTTSLFVIAAMGALAIHCGGEDSNRLSHPKLDQDYASRFAGTWQGTGNLVMGGQHFQTTIVQRIDNAGYNRLTLVQLCGSANGTAGLDSATSFSIDPMTCPPLSESCGPVTVKFDTGVGNLAGNVLTMTLTGSASGCGQNLPYSLTFTGTVVGVANGGMLDVAIGAGGALAAGIAGHGAF